MKPVKKCAAGTRQLHAALAETDPAGTGLILLPPAGLHPAFRPPPLPQAPGPALRRAPAWRTRACTRRKIPASPG